MTFVLIGSWTVFGLPNRGQSGSRYKYQGSPRGVILIAPQRLRGVQEALRVGPLVEIISNMCWKEITLEITLRSIYLAGSSSAEPLCGSLSDGETW